MKNGTRLDCPASTRAGSPAALLDELLQHATKAWVGGAGAGMREVMLWREAAKLEAGPL